MNKGCFVLGLILISQLSFAAVEKPNFNKTKESTGQSQASPLLKWTIRTIGPVSLMTYGAFAWWTKGISRFYFNDQGSFGKNSYSGGSDKLGHFQASYYWSKVTSRSLEAIGEDKKTALMWASFGNAATFTLVEILDGVGYHGAEWWDQLFNVAGVGLNHLLESYPTLGRMVRPSTSYFPSEKFIKGDFNKIDIAEDYNGWKYYLDVNPMQLPALQPFLIQNDALNFFGHLPQLSFGFTTDGFKPAHDFPSLTLSLGLGVDLMAVMEFMEQKVLKRKITLLKEVFSHVKIIPYYTLAQKKYNYRYVNKNTLVPR